MEEEARLYEDEVFWRDHQAWLEAAGYIMRPRLHPNWVPSWFIDQRKRQFTSEDNLVALEGSLIDATREWDGLRVMLKRINVQRHPMEIPIACLFSTEPLASNPRNHCVPVYEILQLPEDSNFAILVMPLLLMFDKPPFVCLGEIIEFFQQLLEGLHFMHQHNVAHCDVKCDNVLSDTLQLFCVPPHPLTIITNLQRTGRPIPTSTRMQKSVKHYFVDFGLSYLYPPGSSRLQRPGYGGTRSVPEFQNNATELCDPFAVDVYCMGDFMRTRFRQGEKNAPAFKGVEFLDDLIADMVYNDPKKRPTMDEVVERFSEIIDRLSQWKLMSRASTVDETKKESIVKTVRYWIGLP